MAREIKMSKNNRGMRHGRCRICGEETLLSFEHIPPRKTGNKGPANLYKPQLIDSNSTIPLASLDHMKYDHQSRRGMGGYTLCESCNNYCGKFYVQPFCAFYEMMKEAVRSLSPEEMKSSPLLAFESVPVILPAVFKQLVANMCCTTQSGSMLDCRDFLLDKNNTEFPEHFNLFMQIVSLDARFLQTGWGPFIFMDETYCMATMLSIPPLRLILVDRHTSDLAFIDNPDYYNLGMDITYYSTIPWNRSVNNVIVPFNDAAR